MVFPPNKYSNYELNEWAHIASMMLVLMAGWLAGPPKRFQKTPVCCRCLTNVPLMFKNEKKINFPSIIRVMTAPSGRQLTRMWTGWEVGHDAGCLVHMKKDNEMSLKFVKN